MFHIPAPHAADAVLVPQIRLDVVTNEEAQNARGVDWDNGVLVIKATPLQFTTPGWVRDAAQLRFNRLQV